MTQQELNTFILQYLVANKTKSAIMLTGGWGTGKSHYIQNSLIPFLAKEENGKHQCVVVSLYGIESLSDVSRNIYFGLRTAMVAKLWESKISSRFSKKTNDITHEVSTIGKGFAKTVLNGLAGKVGLSLNLSDKDLDKIYQSIDLGGKLIILEDLERSSINILEVLGYVNNLVEQDGVKVLLVANEDDILKTETKTRKNNQGKEETYKVYTDLAYQYLRTKEKTVSDTIHYSEDFSAAIQEIIRSFDNPVLNRYISQDAVNDIFAIMSLCKSRNLRSFIYACQKSVDIYILLGSPASYNDDFLKTIFYGILFYVFRLKSGKNMAWKQGDMFSIELGDTQYPLFKFCYDYLTNQVINITRVQESQDALKEYRLFDKNKSNTDPDIYTLSTFHLHTEEEVEAALHNIEDRLENHPEDISFYMYGTIAVYAITYKDCIGRNIDNIKHHLVENLKRKGKKLSIDSIRRTLLGKSASDKAKEEYQRLIDQMKEALEGDQNFFEGFDYLPEQAQHFRLYVDKNRMAFHLQDGFVYKLDVSKLAEMFYQSTPAQKDEIRISFHALYDDSNIKTVMSRDHDSVINLLHILENQRSKDVGDKINQMQYDWFIENLKGIAQELS